MEEKIVITKRFRNNTLRVYQYLLKKFSAKTAYAFIDRLEKRIDFIARNPAVGRLSVKRKNVRSILFTPHNQIYYRYQKNKIEILCLFDMRKNPKKKPY
jgi:plasmid stabilization system protein ParE